MNNNGHNHRAILRRIAHRAMLEHGLLPDFSTEALYHLAIVSGMRQGELLGLKWSDLQWNNATLYVQRQLQVIPGEGYGFTEPKTRSGRRTIRLGEATLSALRDHRQRQQQEQIVAGNRWTESGLVFTSTIGTAVDHRNLYRDYHRTLDRAGLPRIRFHDLRHTAASLMLNHGIPIIVASKRLGHAKPSITLDVYGHLMNEMQGDAARIMDELVTPVAVDIPGNTKVLHKTDLDGYQN